METLRTPPFINVMSKSWLSPGCIFVKGSHGAEVIQNSCTGSLVHFAVLCDFIGWLEPNSKPQMDGICDRSLERLGDLTQGMCFDEYTYLDLLLKVRC